MFNAVMFSTIDYCNRKCSWCPNFYDLRKTKKLMSLDTFHNILKQLKDINYKGSIAPFGNNEPLTDDRIFNLIHQIRLQFNNDIVIHTNGEALFDPVKFKQFIESELTEIKINWYGTDEEYIKLVNLLFFDIHKKTNICYGKKISITQIKTPPLHFWNRGGNIQNIKPLEQDTICFIPFHWLSINHNGDVYLCCSDWKYEVVFGNINETNIMDIWNNSKYKKYRELHAIHQGKELPLCNRCNLIK